MTSRATAEYDRRPGSPGRSRIRTALACCLPGCGRRTSFRRATGVVLIIVLVTVVVLSLAAYTFSSLMQTHYHAAKLSGQRLQARLLVDSGVEFIKVFLMQDEATREEMGGNYNNPLMFQGISVIPDMDMKTRGSFTVIAPLVDDTGMAGVRYGLEDESTRLNLNLLLLVDRQVREVRGVHGKVAKLVDRWLACPAAELASPSPRPRWRTIRPTTAARPR